MRLVKDAGHRPHLGRLALVDGMEDTWDCSELDADVLEARDGHGEGLATPLAGEERSAGVAVDAPVAAADAASGGVLPVEGLGGEGSAELGEGRVGAAEFGGVGRVAAAGLDKCRRVAAAGLDVCRRAAAAGIGGRGHVVSRERAGEPGGGHLLPGAGLGLVMVWGVEACTLEKFGVTDGGGYAPRRR